MLEGTIVSVWVATQPGLVLSGNLIIGLVVNGLVIKVEAAEPAPKDDETHDAYMSRCQEAGYSKEECMLAHKSHKFMGEENLKNHEGCRSIYVVQL